MDAKDFNLTDFLPYRLAVLTARVSKRLSLVYGEKYGLTIPEWRVIVHLSHSEKVSVRDIHKCVNLEKPRVSRAVAKLERAGLVKKTVSGADHRLLEISLTPEGWQVQRGIVPDALKFEENLLSSFDAADLSQLFALMEQLHAELDKDPQADRRSEMDVTSR